MVEVTRLKRKNDPDNELMAEYQNTSKEQQKTGILPDFTMGYHPSNSYQALPLYFKCFMAKNHKVKKRSNSK